MTSFLSVHHQEKCKEKRTAHLGEATSHHSGFPSNFYKGEKECTSDLDMNDDNNSSEMIYEKIIWKKPCRGQTFFFRHLFVSSINYE